LEFSKTQTIKQNSWSVLYLTFDSTVTQQFMVEMMFANVILYD